MLRIDTHLVKRGLSGRDDECGDTGFVQSRDSYYVLALIDALGHGREAAAVAQAAWEFLQDSWTLMPGEILTGMHEHLKGSRGAVASICRLDVQKASVIYAGIGNISAKIFGLRHVSFINADGVIGYMMPHPRESEADLKPSDVLIMISDGIRSSFPPEELDYTLRDSASYIAEEIMKRFAKNDDDASCLVARCLR